MVPMQPSAEFESLVRQPYEKEASGELLEFINRFFSHQNGGFVIGADPNEWFEDYESSIQFYEAASAAGWEITTSVLKAYCEGTVGWAMDHVTVKLPTGIEVPVRHTYIFQRE